MDGLKNASDVEVVAPEVLRNEEKAELAEAVLQYTNALGTAPVLGVGGVTE